MPEVVRSREVSSREDFTDFCNRRRIDVAAEIGVEQGVFASRFMSRWNGTMLVLVDDWVPHMPDNPDDRTPDMITACLVMLPYFGRYKFFRLDSLTAAMYIPAPIEIQFAYVDASHDYESVANDLEAWWERLTQEGILAGHDYDPTHPGVIRAVNEFADKQGKKVYMTSDHLPSWYVFKGEEPEEEPDGSADTTG
jgi:hypothetical protein